MGQQQGVPCCNPHDLRYAACSSSELRHLVGERGLGKQCRRRGGLVEADRATLIAILKAYDAGVVAARGRAFSGDEAACDKANEQGDMPLDYWCQDQEKPRSDLEVVQQILNAPGPKGVDIGGTLWKVVLAMPCELEEECRYATEFGVTSLTRHDLDFQCEFAGQSYMLRFASGNTGLIEAAITNIQSQIQLECLDISGKPAPSDEEFSEASSTRGSSRIDSKELPSSRNNSRSSSSNSLVSEAAAADDHVATDLAPMMQQVFTAGGGAHKFAQLFREALHVDVVAVKELAAVVDGLIFLMLHGPRAGSLFVAHDGADESAALPWPEAVFPFIVVNIGSGVSILRVNSADEGDYVRVGGTACGGGTFLGLARAMTSAVTFEDALQLAQGGDASKCDLLVRDIYGDEGSVSLGLAGGLTASNFGRLCDAPDEDDITNVCSERDIARSLLQMVTQQSVLLSSAFARHAGCIDRVFFVGGFVEKENHLARRAIATNFESLGGRAYFLRHSDYLGALGSLWSCLRASGISTGEEIAQAE